jgi:hypothetical protein
MKTRQGKTPRKVAAGMADTGSVVNTVTGYAVQGRLKVSGNDAKRNSMVSGNTGMRKRG